MTEFSPPRGIVGAILIDPERIERCFLEDEDFDHDVGGYVASMALAGMRALHREDVPISLVTLWDYLKTCDVLRELNPASLSELLDEGADYLREQKRANT